MGEGETLNGKEARGSERREGKRAQVEIGAVDFGGGKKKKGKKRDDRRSKLFRESRATLLDVRSVDMLLKFNPLPNQHVFVEVPEDVEVHEFVSISRYANYKGYDVVHEKQMSRVMLQRLQNTLVQKVEAGDEEERRRGHLCSRTAGCSTSGY